MQGYTMTDVGVDYITATTRDEAVQDKWWSLWQEHINNAKNGALGPEPWRNRWYQGHRCEGVVLATSQQLGTIMMAQGATAAHWWHKMYPTRGRVTRLDAQVTTRFERRDEKWAERLYERICDCKARKSSIILNSRGGATLYVGSRNSDQFGRIYDKGIQAKLAERGELWRYECQFGKPRAHVVAGALYDVWSRERTTHGDVIGLVYRWFQARGVTTPFAEQGGTLVCEVERKVTTLDSKLRWLRSQIAPTVNRLIAEGHGKETIEALGLTYNQLVMHVPEWELAARQQNGDVVNYEHS